MSVKDDLAGVLADSLNKKFKDYKVAYFLDGAQETPTDITTITLSGWRSQFGKIVSDSSMTSSQKKASLLKKAARQDETNDGSYFGTDIIFNRRNEPSYSTCRVVIDDGGLCMWIRC